MGHDTYGVDDVFLERNDNFEMEDHGIPRNANLDLYRFSFHFFLFHSFLMSPFLTHDHFDHICYIN